MDEGSRTVSKRLTSFRFGKYKRFLNVKVKRYRRLFPFWTRSGSYGYLLLQIVTSIKRPTNLSSAKGFIP